MLPPNSLPDQRHPPAERLYLRSNSSLTCCIFRPAALFTASAYYCCSPALPPSHTHASALAPPPPHTRTHTSTHTRAVPSACDLFNKSNDYICSVVKSQSVKPPHPHPHPTPRLKYLGFTSDQILVGCGFVAGN